VEPECRIRLEVFEGPLDLLLHLINRNRLSITDISISLVTNQYLEYLAFLKALDIEVAAEYLVMAATLMQIKSKMLLPAKEPSNEEEPSTVEILGSLEELKRIKFLADTLEQRPVLERDVFLPAPDILIQTDRAHEDSWDHADVTFDVSILDLMDAFKKVLGSSQTPRTMEIIRARVDMEARLEEIEEILKKRGRVEFRELFDGENNRPLIIASFLAILELARRALIRLIQDAERGKIFLVGKPGFIRT